MLSFVARSAINRIRRPTTLGLQRWIYFCFEFITLTVSERIVFVHLVELYFSEHTTLHHKHIYIKIISSYTLKLKDFDHDKIQFIYYISN